MAQQADSYPSPTAAQTGSGVSPYQQTHPDPTDEPLDLSAQLHVGPNVQSPPHHDNDPRARLSGSAYATAVAQQLNQQNENAYGYPPGSATPQPYQGPIPGISGPPPALSDDSSARKKQKITRACDECRRKKIKCDAESDAPNSPRCSNCQRTNAECRFSRAPQKRGPSKGYIRELSERVAQLESTNRQGYGEPGLESPIQLNALSDRKRTFSMTGESAAFLNQESPLPERYRPEPPKSFAPPPVPEAQMQVNSSRADRVRSLGIELATPDTFAPFPMRPLHQVEERNLQDFIHRVNPLFPLLGSREGINNNLQYCHPPLYQAFFFAIGAVVGTLEPSSGEQTRSQCAQGVYQLLGEVAGSTGGPLSEKNAPWGHRPYQANLVMLHVFLLLVLHHESSSTPAQHDPYGAYTCDQLLAQAKRMVDHLYLRHVTESAHLGHSSDAGRVFASARRAYWVFVVLDIWNSIGRGGPRHLANLSVDSELVPSDRSVLGVEFHAFVRRSGVAGSFIEYLRTIRSNSNDIVNAGHFARSMLYTSFSTDPSVHSSLGSVVNIQSEPLAALAFQTADTLLALTCAGPAACPPTSQIFTSVSKLATLISQARFPEGTPLAHHFVVLATKVLVRASRFPPRRSIATSSLREVLHAVRGNKILDASPWRDLVEQALIEGIESEKSGGMGGIENGAIQSVEGSKDEDMEAWKTEWAAIAYNGYLRGFISS